MNSAVLATAADVLEFELDAEFYAGMAELPHFNPDLDHDPVPDAVRDLREAVTEAHAVLFSTPEYAGVMPGALKNLLEWTIGATVLSGKPVGWINPSTAPGGAAGTYANLRTVLGYTGATVVEDACVDVPVARADIGPDGTIGDEGIRDAIRDAVIKLAG